ncbi:MAG: TonB-dependent receptor [Gammaproteobacteria bacterium]
MTLQSTPLLISVRAIARSEPVSAHSPRGTQQTPYRSISRLYGVCHVPKTEPPLHGGAGPRSFTCRSNGRRLHAAGRTSFPEAQRRDRLPGLEEGLRLRPRDLERQRNHPVHELRYQLPCTSIYQLFNSQYGNLDLGPENGWTVEAGLRQSALDGQLKAELIYWHTELDDIISFVSGRFVDGVFTRTYENRDKGVSEGVEVIVNWWVTDEWRLDANYTYTDAHSEQDGERFRTVQVARNTGNLGVSYVRDRWSAGANVYYSGPHLRWKGDIEMDAYTRVDLFGRYNFFDSFSVFGRVENLFDEDIEEGLGYEQPGIYMTAGIDYRFGL